MASIKQIVLILVVSGLLVVALTYLVSSQKSDAPELRTDNVDFEFKGPLTAEEHEVTNPKTMSESNPHAIFKTNRGDIELELYAEDMPVTVGNFIALAEDGFYEQVKFHRVIEGFMIQGGDPNSKGDDESIYGTGGPGFTIQDEFVEGEHLSNVRGTIAMANTGQPNSGGSQWFINLADNTPLDFNVPDPNNSQHPVFGRVVSGIEVVDEIGSVATKPGGLPVEPVVIETIEIIAK